MKTLMYIVSSIILLFVGFSFGVNIDDSGYNFMLKSFRMAKESVGLIVSIVGGASAMIAVKTYKDSIEDKKKKDKFVSSEIFNLRLYVMKLKNNKLLSEELGTLDKLDDANGKFAVENLEDSLKDIESIIKSESYSRFFRKEIRIVDNCSNKLKLLKSIMKTETNKTKGERINIHADVYGFLTANISILCTSIENTIEKIEMKKD